MSIALHVPDELGGRLASEAARRHMTVDELAAELVTAGLGQAPTGKPRRLGFAGAGASGTTRGARDADELLAEGFGRD